MSIKKNVDYNNYYQIAKSEALNKNYENAIKFYKKLINYNNKNLTYLKELANLYMEIKNFNEAIEYYKKLVSFEKNSVEIAITLNQIGVCYSNINNYTNAIEYFEKVLIIKNDIPDVYNNIGFCYWQLKNFELCEKTYYKSLRIQKQAAILSMLGDLYLYTKKYELSIKCFKKVDNFENNNQEKYKCSFPYLANKDFIEGYKLYESRLRYNNICKQTNNITRVEIPQLQYWDGMQNCNNLLIVYEQGIGDNIQYFKYIIELSELYPDMNIVFFCKENVAGLFYEYNNIQIICNLTFESIVNYDYKLFIMSLPYILKLNNVTPNKTNYIKSNSEKIEYWKNELSYLKKYRIGFTCIGLLSSVIDKNIPLPEFNILFDENVDLICLHKMDEVSEEIKEKCKDKITFLDIDKDVPFQDTIAILHNIDLLITVDTYIVHLAGVLNIKTLLLLGYVSDWRWFNDDICHWYKSVEIIRMKENKELKYILPEVKKKLNEILST